MSVEETKVELLRKVDMFSPLREYELDIIARYSEFVTIPKGSALFSQGAPAGELYVVSSGRIGIVGMESDSDVMVAQIIGGESFGELDFLGGTVRSAMAFAEEESILLRFPAGKHRAEEIFLKHPDISARMLYRLMGIVTDRVRHVNAMLLDKTLWLKDLRKQLLSDKMTGLYNQAYLDEDFTILLAASGGCALIMIKPDNFKAINDRYGHETGDQVLNLIAIFLQSELGEDDIGIRYRGDEFAAVLMECDGGMAVKRAGDIGRVLGEMDLTGAGISADTRITVSIGIALYPREAGTSGELVEAAHRKMFEARNAGGDRIAV